MCPPNAHPFAGRRKCLIIREVESVIYLTEEIGMTNTQKPLQLDRDIVYEEKAPPKEKRKKGSGIVVFGGVGAVLIMVVLLYQPEGSGFVDSPPPLEQAERDSVAAVFQRVQDWRAMNDSMPTAPDLDLPAGFLFELEYDDVWSLRTPEGLYYTSDMGIEPFRAGEL